MLIGDYRKAYPKHWESYDAWFTPELCQIFDKPEFLDMVMAKIKEEPDNFEFHHTLHEHYMLMKEYRKALEVINNMIIKFPELAEDLQKERDNALYIDGDTVEERRNFREFFNSKEELYAAIGRVSKIRRRIRITDDTELNKTKELVAEEPNNPVFWEGLWEIYVIRFELDKAKEVALKIIDIAQKKGVKEVVLKKYSRNFLDSLDMTKYHEARDIYWVVYYRGNENLITPEIIEKYDLKK